MIINYLLRKSLISSHNIPNFTDRSFYSYARNNTAVDTSIFLQPKTILSATAKTKNGLLGTGRPIQSSLETMSYQ